ncbi:transmembrane protein, putative [Bodo saltans]|uniref:Transmembrane protein, putative n=1 Tax=Bodo saltans TaxID=75058 RepID=A0A0S4J9W9_BODSA|nr:transmembrane protein, putative [Bodo saltans]|eukprot:CUG79759.1 transmembrane protein, putative [Bodo saltans]
MIANGVEVTLALLQQRFIGRGKDEPDDIIQRRRHQHVVMAFAEAFSETLPQFAVQVHTYTIGALDPVVFFVSGALTLVSVVKSILTFILQFEDILQLSDSQKILQRSLAENPIQADVWMTLGHYNAPVVLGKEISPAACNMEASHCWVNHFLALHKLTLHRVDYNRDEQHVTLRGHRYERLECFVNAVKGWCRAMALYEKYGNPFVLNKTSEYRTRMALGWYYIASVEKAELEKYVESWFTPQECYQASLELDDANAQAWLGLAKCNGGVVDGVDCNEVMCLKEALHRNADLEDAYMQLGLLLAERLQSNKKHAAATQLNPFGAPHTTEELTIVLIDERVLDATKCFSEVLARNHKNSLAFLNLGKCLLNVEGETSSGAAAATVRGFPHSLDSKSCFVNCLQLDATCAEAYYCLAMSLKEMMTINQSALLLGSNNNTTTVAATTTATIAGKTLSIVDCLVAAIAHDERMKAAYVQLGQHLDNGVTVTITPYRRSSSEEKETQRVFTNQKCFVEAICLGDDSPRVYYHLAECMGATDTVSITRHQAHQPTRRGQRIQRKSEHSLKLTKVQVFAHSIVETSDSMTDDDRASNAVALHFIGSHLHTWGSAASESIPALSASPMTSLDCLVAACDADPLVGRYFESLGDELTRIDAERRPLTVAPQQFTPSIAILHNGVQYSAKDCYVQSAQLDFSRASNLEKLAALMNDTEQLNLRRNYHHPRSGDADDGDDHGVSGGGGGAAAMLLNTMSKLDVLIHLLALQDAPAQTLWSIGNCLRLSSTTTTTTLPPSTSFPVIITTKEGNQFASRGEDSRAGRSWCAGVLPPSAALWSGRGATIRDVLVDSAAMTGNAPTVLDIGGGVQLTKVGALCKVLELDDTCCEALDCLWRLLPADSSCLTTTEDNGGGTHSSWTRLSCLLRLIHLEHALSSSYYALGQLLEQHNKVSIVTEDGDTFSVEELYLEAIASAEKFIHPDAYCSLGTLRAKAEAQLIPSLDQLEEVLLPDGAKVSAAQCFRHAVACDPTCGVAFYHLGCALGRLDRLVLPVSMATHEEFTVTVGGAADVTELSRSECLQYALTCDPTISGAYFALAEFLVLDDVVEIAGKRYTKQALLLETIHRTTSGSSSSSISGCSRSSDDGRTLAKAFLLLHKSLKDGGGDEATASLTLLSGGKLTSRDCLVNAIAADNCSGDAFFELGQWLVKRNQTSASSTVQIAPGTPPLTAKQCFICAIERDASNGAAYGALCGLLGDDEIVQMRTGRLTKRDALMEAIYLNPTDESAMRTMLGWIEESAESSFQLKNGEVVTRTSLLALILSVTTDLASTYFDLGIALVSAREPSIQLPKNNITLTPMQCFIESIRYAAPPAEAAASSQAPTTTSRGDAKLLPRAVSRIYDALLRIGTLMKDSDVLTVPDGPYREKFKNLTRVQCFVEAIALNPDHAIGYALVAKTLSSMRFPFKPKHEKKGLSQVECCMKAISLDNSCSTAYFALGKSLKEGATALVDKSKLSRQDCLVRAIEKANDEDNEDDDIVCEAFVALGQALESPTAQVLVGTKLYHQTDCFIKALDTNPRLPDALMERGRALGDREAVSHFGKVLNKKGFIAAAIAGKPDSPFPYYYLGEALVRDQHSLSVSTSALKTSTTTASTAAALPSAKVTRDNRTVSMNAMECFVEAISLMEASILDESIMTSPLHAAAYYQLGLCLTAMADANPSGQSSPPVVHFPKTNTTLTAQECHIEAIHRNPNYAEPYYAVGCLYLKTNENIRLRTKDSKQRDLLTPKECIIKAITLKPTWALPYVRLASTMAAKQSELLPSGPFSKKECLTHALSLDASCGEAYYLLGMTIGNKEQVAVKGMSPLDSRKCFIYAITHARTLWAAYYQLGMLLTDNESVTINNEKYQRSQLMKFRDRAFQATSNHTFE